jgi:hypothetical protein
LEATEWILIQPNVSGSASAYRKIHKTVFVLIMGSVDLDSESFVSNFTFPTGFNNNRNAFGFVCEGGQFGDKTYLVQIQSNKIKIYTRSESIVYLYGSMVFSTY